MAFRHSLSFLACATVLAIAHVSLSAHASVSVPLSDRGFAETKEGSNVALLVAVGHGLSGLDIDMKNVERIVTLPEYRFHVTRIEEQQGTVAAVSDELTRRAREAKDDGTLLFYYTGHGAEGLIWLQDANLTVQKIRKSIEDGRRGMKPLKRLVLIYDSCHAGSMMDPMGLGLFPSNRVASQRFADAVVEGLSGPSRDGRAYWEKLVVIASSQADETSLASPSGSIFTNAFTKAFDEALAVNATFESFFKKAQEYTVGHHPVARFVPESLKQETLAP